jgi:hypothetical protein
MRSLEGGKRLPDLFTYLLHCTEGDNINTVVKEIGHKYEDRIYLAQCRDYWLTVAVMALKLQIA